MPSMVNRQVQTLKQSSVLVAFDMEPVVKSDSATFDFSVLYVETGGTIVFRNSLGVVRTVDVPDNFVTPFAVSNVMAASSASGIHRMVL